MACLNKMADSTRLRLLVFEVAGLACGAEVGAVREILSPQAATRVPGAPPEVVGLINVRGSLVTLVDGRRIFGGSRSDRSGSIILLDVGSKQVGLLVDEVLDLIDVDVGEMAEQRDLPGVDSALVRAVGHHGDASFVLLDLDAVLGPILIP